MEMLHPNSFGNLPVCLGPGHIEAMTRMSGRRLIGFSLSNVFCKGKLATRRLTA